MKHKTTSIREIMGLTQKEFSEKFGVSLRTVQGWDANETMPDYLYQAFWYIYKMETCYDCPYYQYSDYKNI